MHTSENEARLSLSQERFWSRRGIGMLLLEIVLVAIGERLLNPLIDLASSLVTQQIPSSSTVLLGSVALGAFFTATILGVLLVQRTYRWIKIANQAMQTVSAKPKSDISETALNDRAINQLMRMARMESRSLLKQNLRLIGEELEAGRIPPHFRIWEEIEPELKKRLVTKQEYDALEDFAKSLTQCPRRDEPNFDVMSDLCKTHYEHLKRLGLVTENSKQSSPISPRTTLEFEDWDGDVKWFLARDLQPSTDFHKSDKPGADTASTLHCKQTGRILEFAYDIKGLDNNKRYYVQIGLYLSPQKWHPKVPDTIIHSAAIPNGEWDGFPTDAEGSSGERGFRVDIDYDLGKKGREVLKRHNQDRLELIQLWVNEASTDKAVLGSDPIPIKRKPLSS